LKWIFYQILKIAYFSLRIRKKSFNSKKNRLIFNCSVFFIKFYWKIEFKTESVMKIVPLNVSVRKLPGLLHVELAVAWIFPLKQLLVWLSASKYQKECVGKHSHSAFIARLFLDLNTFTKYLSKENVHNKPKNLKFY
jgi:hypothetical protein